MRVSRRRGTVLLTLLVLVLAAACGGDGTAPEGIEDPGAVPLGEDVPDWFPGQVRPPAGSVVVEVIDDPAPDFGRTVTWRATGGFDDVTDHVERLLAGLGWAPAEETETEGDTGSRRRTYFIRNDTVFSVRVFEDESLDGVRLAVELPATR
ncbi:MAG: hypothetical protein GEV08_15990 [Acidimicrobiia bacterium]|nr:hypothetical protein [Acidimicrobiia bacterium]